MKLYLLLPFIILPLCSCTTTTTTSPDGTIVTVRSSDPKAIKILAGAVATGVAQGVTMSLEAQGR